MVILEKKKISYIDWIESIPISETRYYVKKVLANLRIYQKNIIWTCMRLTMVKKLH